MHDFRWLSYFHVNDFTGTAQQVFEWGTKEECVKENFFRAGGGGGMLVDFYSISLK